MRPKPHSSRVLGVSTLARLHDSTSRIVRAIHAAEKSPRPPAPEFFAQEYLRNRGGFPLANAPEDYKLALAELDNAISEAANGLYENAAFTGVAVFFLPETNKDLPLFFGQIALWDGALLPSQKEMREKIGNEIATILRKEWPRDDPQIPETHFFVWMRRLMDVYKGGLTLTPGKGVTIEGQTVAVFPPQHDHQKFDVSADGSTISWTPSRRYCPFTATSLHVDTDTFVLVATFFPQATRSQLARWSRIHSLTTPQLFAPLYNFVQSETRQILRKELARNLIEPSLLSRAARELRGDRGAITYPFTWHETKYDCSDLHHLIENELASHPRDLFDLVIEFQGAIYEKLRAEWEDHALALQRHGFSQGDSLPEQMPFAQTMKDLERAQRAMHRTGRDHVVHQFQVFLLGLFVLNRCMDDLSGLGVDSLLGPRPKTSAGGDNEPTVKEPFAFVEKEKEKEAFVYLLRLTWFLASNFHDIGYPIQEVTETAKSLYKETAQLLRVNPEFAPVAAPFSIESVLYDEPRAYILARHLATCLPRVTTVDSREAWWYFVRNCLFYRRDHAVVSALALGLSLIPAELETEEMEEFLHKRAFGRILTNSILLPILVHHAGDWARYANERVTVARKAKREEIAHNKKLEPKSQRKVETDKTKRIGKALSLLFTQVAKKKAAAASFKMPLERCPIAGILGYCDNVQEDGRPMGVAATAVGWATAESAELTNCDASREHLRFDVTFTGGEIKWKQSEMTNAKIIFENWDALKNGFCTAMFESTSTASHFSSVTFRHRPKCESVCKWWKDEK